GDFGLVYAADDGSRVSATYENVGSRDWMPGWAQGVMLEEVKPTFDVFSLGKTLWSMVSGLPVMQLWYFDRPPNDLTEHFPGDPNVRLLKSLFSRCIVEEEEDCLPNAQSMLEEIDSLIFVIELDGDEIADDVTRSCRVCGQGEYGIIADRDRTEASNFGIQPAGRRSFKIFSCRNCGHVQLFFFDEGESGPPAWEENTHDRLEAKLRDLRREP
ncbi:MAG: hypothetical protein IH831_05870, partial [Planctomycetes bacterium]|nr:hypothetical protein [Planctomycetota bacterium]